MSMTQPSFLHRSSGLLVCLTALLLQVGCEGLFAELPDSPPGQAFVTVAAGGYHTCAVVGDGSTLCWGMGDRGQLGDGGTEDSGIPIKARGDEGAVELGAGVNHSCSIIDDEVHCWGANGQGQVGQDGVSEQVVPQRVSSLSSVRQIAAGLAFSCAVTSAGEVFCWGRGREGQLGNGQSSVSGEYTPQQVEGLSGVKDLDSGGAAWAGLDIRGHSCAIDAGDELWCWGSGDHGQLGDGQAESSNVPVAVTGLPGAVRSVCTGGNHSCAVVDDGSVMCWGGSYGGKLGNGELGGLLELGDYEAEPVEVVELDNAREVSCGRDFTCALLDDGTVACWGGNQEGQLGNGMDFDDRAEPGKVAALEDVVHLSSGIGHSCAVVDGGQLYCWGRGEELQLGNGSNSASRNEPVQVNWPVD